MPYLRRDIVESIRGLNCEETEKLIKSFNQNEMEFHTSVTFIPKNINPVVIGFAETATALGHAFFDCFKRQSTFIRHGKKSLV